MSNKYTFEVSPCGAKLVLEKGVISNSWNDIAKSDKLVVNSGKVNDSEPGKLICQADGIAVITLNGAGWDSEVGGDGNSASCDLCTQTPSNQTWVLTKKE